MRYLWYHFRDGLIGSAESVDGLVKVMEASVYLKADEGKLKAAMILTDEYKYYNDVFTVRKINN